MENKRNFKTYQTISLAALKYASPLAFEYDKITCVRVCVCVCMTYTVITDCVGHMYLYLYFGSTVCSLHQKVVFKIFIFISNIAEP